MKWEMISIIHIKMLLYSHLIFITQKLLFLLVLLIFYFCRQGKWDLGNLTQLSKVIIRSYEPEYKLMTMWPPNLKLY
jgi:Na+-transporting NADH:ubiquinone oxidoreductase subunit NqrB